MAYFKHVIMYEVHEGNALWVGHARQSVRMFQVKNYWTDNNKIWYGR
jgi:hypothetical protein